MSSSNEISRTELSKAELSRKEISWPRDDFSRVPLGVFNDQDVYDLEMERVFRGPVWCYLALEAELPNPNDYLTTYVGDTPIVVNRAADGTLHAFVNRCAHKGTMLVRKTHGSVESHTCIYHHWCYDQSGKLIGVPFQRGYAGRSGMPADFDKADHGLQTLKVAVYRGVIFGSFHTDIEPLEDYLDGPMRDYLDQVFGRPIEILGYWRQAIPGNWKFYFENLMDSYHAGLLHQFQATFGISRSTQRGGSHLDKLARHRIIYVEQNSDDIEAAKAGYGDAAVIDDTLKLGDSRMVEFIDEVGDNRAILMMTLFPNGFFQRLSNTLAARQIRPKSPNEFELYWTVFGYADDNAELRERRMLQNNMIGPAGLVSIEDGEVGALIQRVLGHNTNRHTVIEMGGRGPITDPDSPLTEVPVRGFWRYYCHLMSFEPEGGSSWRP